MLYSRTHTDYIVFCDVYSFQIFHRTKTGETMLIAVHAAYDSLVHESSYEKQLAHTMKQVTSIIHGSWQQKRIPTVLCVVSDVYMHTVFHQITHIYSKDTKITPDFITRAVKRDMRGRAFDQLVHTVPVGQAYYGYTDAEVVSFTANGYAMPLPFTKKVVAREAVIQYGAALCSKKLYQMIRDTFQRSQITLQAITSMTLHTMKTQNKKAALHSGVCIVQDTISSLCVFNNSTVLVQSVPVGIASLFSTYPHMYTHAMLIRNHGIAKRYKEIFYKVMGQWITSAYESYRKGMTHFLHTYTLQKLSMTLPYAVDADNTTQQLFQKMLYPGIRSYTNIRESSKLIARDDLVVHI